MRRQSIALAGTPGPARKRRRGKWLGRDGCRVRGAQFGGLVHVPVDPQVDEKPFTCFNCRRPGHRMAECAELRTMLVCYNCGRLEVTMRTCPRCGPAHSGFMAERKEVTVVSAVAAAAHAVLCLTCSASLNELSTRPSRGRRAPSSSQSSNHLWARNFLHTLIFIHSHRGPSYPVRHGLRYAQSARPPNAALPQRTTYRRPGNLQVPRSLGGCRDLLSLYRLCCVGARVETQLTRRDQCRSTSP